MTIYDHYINWLSNPQELSWIEYYNLIVTKKWIRQSKQRNYKRNNDIVYRTSKIQKNNSNYKFGININESDYFYIDNQYLKYDYSNNEYNKKDGLVLISPFKFITMDVTNCMNLVVDIPNMILDKEFEIDNNGNLILNYG